MKFILHATPEITPKPLIAEVILETGTLLNIDRADVKSSGGEVIIDVHQDRYNIVTAAFKKRGATITPLEQPIIKDDDECVNCGACISVCPTGVISFNDDWTVQMEIAKCVQCGACVIMCPQGALKVSK
ncbi:MAG: 4Fe-4S dicluster domain-containing protein [ANME-2 cluster archaeon]|nr:4Fe-4S dicluster domain-containing protein [ANME-2 cluster archaeon]